MEIISIPQLADKYDSDWNSNIQKIDLMKGIILDSLSTLTNICFPVVQLSASYDHHSTWIESGLLIHIVYLFWPFLLSLSLSSCGSFGFTTIWWSMRPESWCFCVCPKKRLRPWTSSNWILDSNPVYMRFLTLIRSQCAHLLPPLLWGQFWFHSFWVINWMNE